ncbi:MAG: quinone-dependent dihydroorotate dehydrogenase [Alphaproteobacteria bacterium]|nr:quinone-dependent dihydroorotate dehydrogenase [Alphaproteobacteria bacterium]
MNFYPLIRPFLFQIDPEMAHTLTLKMLGFRFKGFGLGPQGSVPDDPILRTSVFGLDFPNPIMLGAGLDKQATVIDAFMNFGFGSMEIGTVTPLPQPGNPKPRMFRIEGAKALINRFGFNSVGIDVFTERLKAWRNDPARTTNPVGVNLGKNKDSADDADDYVTCFNKAAPYADFVVINISSPNTPGLRELQTRERLAQLLAEDMKARNALAPQLPVLVKIAPDLTDEQQKDIAAVILASGVQALIVSNTTLARPSNIPAELAKEAGGLSGPPLFGPSTRLLATMYKLTEGKIPLIGCGGVTNGEEAYAKIRAGASLVQVYTALVYEGPMVINRIKRELAALLRRDGFASVAEAVGADSKA